MKLMSDLQLARYDDWMPQNLLGSGSNMPELPFSQRLGFRSVPQPITVREDAPLALRQAIVVLGETLGLRPHGARSVVCSILLVLPDNSNWSAYPNVHNEVVELVETAPWYRVYDIAEAFYQSIRNDDFQKAAQFECRLNEFFEQNGIGWQMRDGTIVARGSESFSHAESVAQILQGDGRSTAALELHEAFRDLSRRPNADVTGAIQHAMAALECLARDVTNSPSKNLGQLVERLGIPKPLDIALEKMWGYASEQGRHLREGRIPRFEEAELVVSASAALCGYINALSRRGS